MSSRGLRCYIAKPIDHVSDVEDICEIDLSNEQDENDVSDTIDNSDETGNIDASEDLNEDSESEQNNSRNLSTRTRNPLGYLINYVTGLENVGNQIPNHL